MTETFAAGKPMLVLPLFGDQFDNAQRLTETGYGARLDPYDFTPEQLLNQIDLLLGDSELRERCAKAADRLKTTDRHAQLAILLEEMAIAK